jgi:hypothetical protein
LQFGVQNFLGVGIAKDQLIPIVKKSIEDICAHSPLGMYTSPLSEPLVNVGLWLLVVSVLCFSILL